VFSAANQVEVQGPLTRRRAMLAPRPNPARNADYLVRLEGAVETALGNVVIELTYVPDTVILAPDAFAAYLKALTRESWGSIEELGGALLADIESEAVPRYMRLTLRNAAIRGPVSSHAALFEGCQPGWKNDAMLARLR
jgi:hypothetical protein